MYKVDFPTHFTSSLDIEPCSFKWAVGRIFNLRQERRFDRDLDFGGAFAEALYLARKAYYIKLTSKHEAEEEAEDYVDSVFGVTFAKAMAERKQNGKAEEKIKTPERLVNLLKLYWKAFPLDKEKIAPFLLNGSISAEQALHIPFGEGLFLSIKPDMLAISERGFTTALDEKTVGNAASETRFPEYVYMLRPQFLLYIYGIDYLIKKRELDLPDLKVFEVRRAIIGQSVSSGNDFCHPLTYEVNRTLSSVYFKSFKEEIFVRKSALDLALFAFQEKLEDFTEEKSIFYVENLIEEFFPKNFHQCYMYGRPCPLIEHCSVGRSLSYLGFKTSSVNTVTKEVEFYN